jgi:hypothetical protein
VLSRIVCIGSSVSIKSISHAVRRFIISSSGTFTATVPARLSIGIYASSKVPDGSGSPTTTATTALPTPCNVQVTFAPAVTTVYGECVLVVGSLSQLGKWSPRSAVRPISFLRAHPSCRYDPLDLALTRFVPDLERSRWPSRGNLLRVQIHRESVPPGNIFIMS